MSSRKDPYTRPVIILMQMKIYEPSRGFLSGTGKNGIEISIREMFV